MYPRYEILKRHSAEGVVSYLDSPLSVIHLRLFSVIFHSLTLRLPLVIFLFAAGMTGACSNDRSAEDSADSVNRELVTDGLGRTIRLSSTVERIVSLAPGATEVIFAAGALGSLVGVTTADDYPEQVLDLPTFSALPVNFEAVISLKPDLIFASTQVNDPDDARIFEQAGIPVFYLQSNSLAEVLNSIRSVGSVMKTTNTGNAVADALQQRIDVLNDVTAGVDHQPTVLMLLSASDLYSFGEGSYVQDLLRLGGGISITAQLNQAAVNVSEEFVVTERPEIILGTFPAGTDATEFLRHHPQWTDVPAIRKNHIYSIEANLILRPGPRNVEAAEVILSLLHPDILLPGTTRTN